MRHRYVIGIVLTLAAAGFSFSYWNEWAAYRQIQVAKKALRERDAGLAQASAQKAIELTPKNAEAHLLLARAFRRQGHLKEVRQHLTTAHRLGLSTKRLQREEFLAKAQSGQMNEAGPHLSQLLLDAGDDGPEICEAYVNGYFLLNFYAEAIPLLTAWHRDYPNDPQPHVFRGILANTKQKWAEAADYFRKALLLAPTNHEIRMRLVAALVSLHEYQEAIEHFEVLNRQRPNDPEIKIGWSRTLIEQGETTKARQLLQQALEAIPKTNEALRFDASVLLGQLEADDNRVDEALPLLQHAATLKPFDSSVRYSLGRLLLRLGHEAEAKLHFEFVKVAQQADIRLRQLEDKVIKNPEDVQARFEITEILREYGSPEERGAWLRSIVELDPNHSKARLALADYYASIGLVKEAEKLRTMPETPQD